MTRQIVLDTETTGLDPAEHSIIEIGCLEIFDRRLTGARYHQYINPGRDIEEGAVAVHGITTAMLSDKPSFADVAQQVLDFLGDAELIIHNADFDMSFLAVEFARCGRSAQWPPAGGSVLDTLRMARDKHPGQRNTLDALCKRYDVDNSGRDLHGALLDAGLLAEVYLRMTGGQNELLLSNQASAESGFKSAAEILAAAEQPPRVIAASAEELAAHEQMLQMIEKHSHDCLWLRACSDQQQGH